MDEFRNLNIAISWSGLPVYASKLIRSAIDTHFDQLEIISTNLQVPLEISESILGKKVHVVDPLKILCWADIGLEIPDIFFQSGWFVKSFNALGRQVKENGGKVVVLIDNSWKNNIRQHLGYLKFNLLYKRRFDVAWVPGYSGSKFVKFLGFSEKNVFQGLYGSDPKVFLNDVPLHLRERTFIFIGQLIPRKGIDTLIKAFLQFRLYYPDWKLKIYGQGILQNKVETCDGVDFYNFAGPEEISRALASSRFLVLPSREDHWPLVISEAVLSGCGLLISNRIGNKFEFLSDKNGFLFRYNSSNDLFKVMCTVADFEQNVLEEVRQESIRLGSKYLLEHWQLKFEEIVKYLNSK
jgi:glycosyltransferase involved in cell wall biosynthesis